MSYLPSQADVSGAGRGEMTVNRESRARPPARLAVVAITLSVVGMAVLGILGPPEAVPKIPSHWPSLPLSLHLGLSDSFGSALMWLVVSLAGTGLIAGLVAARRGWRPSPRRLMLTATIAVAVLVVLPPTGSADMMLYTVYGRITATHHDPYLFTPEQMRQSGDPIGAIAVDAWSRQPAAYGPLIIATETTVSVLAGDSEALALVLLKVTNALGYLAMMLMLDRATASDHDRRIRAHLLWSVNPLMLWNFLAGGHNDILPALAATAAVVLTLKVGRLRDFTTGVLTGIAIAMKATYALYAVGQVFACKFSWSRILYLLAGMSLVIGPAYFAAGPQAIHATANMADGGASGYSPLFAAAWFLNSQGASGLINIVGLACSVSLVLFFAAATVRRRLSHPAVTSVLMFSIAWLLFSPQQRPWYDAMLFPVLAIAVGNSLDIPLGVRALLANLGQLPRPALFQSDPGLIYAAARFISSGIAPLGLTITGLAVAWIFVRKPPDIAFSKRMEPATARHRRVRNSIMPGHHQPSAIASRTHRPADVINEKRSAPSLEEQ